MLEDRKVKIFLLTLVVALTAGIGIKAFVGFKAPPQAQAEPNPAAQVSQAPVPASELVVYVTGAVVKQGLVKLPPGSRLADALLAAGQGQDSDLTNLNLAEKLKDGQKIVVPRLGEVSTPQAGQAGNIENSTGNANAKAGKININTASAKELDEIPGIGPAMAERIISFRTEKGPFKRPEDLKEVSGIGDKKYAQMAEFVTVD